MAMAARIERFGSAPHYAGTTQLANVKPVWTGKLSLASPAQCRKSLGIRESSLIFTNSVRDFWHENAPDDWRLDALDVIRRAGRHQFQTLTKRPENITPFLQRSRTPLPRNFWTGATVEREDFRHRIDTLRRIPVRTRFLSIEPLLGPLGEPSLHRIHWVIVGGESGPGARPMAPSGFATSATSASRNASPCSSSNGVTPETIRSMPKVEIAPSPSSTRSGKVVRSSTTAVGRICRSLSR